MIRLHIRKGLLGESGVETIPLDPRGFTVRALAESIADKLPIGVGIQIGLNGELLHGDELDQIAEDGDEIVVCPRTTAGVDILGAIVYAIVAAAVSFAVNYLIQALSPRQKPSGVPQERGEESSATYAWDGIQTNYGQGFPVAFGYGRHAVGGQVIYTDVFATTVGGVIDDRLKVAMALTEGPIHRVGDTIADELDNLGGIIGQQPGPPIPNHIRVNNILLQNQANAQPVTNVTLALWTGTRPTNAGDLLAVMSGSTKVGTLQVTDVRNAQSTDLDCLQIDGTAPAAGLALQFNQGLSVGNAAIQGVATVQRLNTNPGARVWIRPGTLDQSALPANPFRGASVTYSPNAQLDEANSESVFTYSPTTEVTTVGFVLSFPGGLYALDPQGNLQAYPVVFEVYWRPEGTTSWRLFFRPQTAIPLRRRLVGENPRVGPVLDSFGADLVRPGDPQQRGPFEIRIVRLSPGGGTDAVSAALWRNVFLNTAYRFTHPRTALIGLELSAGARFSGSLPQFNVRCDLRKIRVWDATHGWSDRCWDVPDAPFNFMVYPPGRNPAWIALDYLLAPFGLGNYVTQARVDLPAFRRWAAFCDQDPSPLDPWGEAAFQCDYIGDSPRPAWEHLIAIMAAGRASPVFRDGKISVVYQYRDAHSDAGVSVAAKAPTQLITSGNCEQVQITWPPRANRPTVYLFQFLNEEDLYAQDVLPVEDDEGTLNDPANIATDEYRPETIQAYGVTRASQLFREGRFRHRVQRLVRRELTLVTGRWALTAEVGDLVDFECNIVRPFDAEVPVNMVCLTTGEDVDDLVVDHLAAGADTIIVRDPNGNPQVRTISNPQVQPNGKHTQFDVSASITVNSGATCVVGMADKLVETYEIVAITLQKDLKREVRLVQWVPEIHDPVVPGDYVGSGNDGAAATSLLLAQPPQEGEPDLLGISVVPRRDGTHDIVVARPVNRASSDVRVFVRESRSEAWDIAGQSSNERVQYDRFVAGRSYVVAAVLETVGGAFGVPEDGQSLTFTAEEFPPFSPPSVTNARAIALDDFVLVQWDDIDVRDLVHYELRHGSTWTAGRVLAKRIEARALIANPPRDGTLLIAARSTSGLYGNPVAVTLPEWRPRSHAEELFEDDRSPSPAGTHSATQWNASDGVIELQAGELSGTYTSAEQDLGYQAPAFWQVTIDVEELDTTPVDDALYRVDSGEARWTTVHGRPASPAHPGADWQTDVDDLTMTLDDAERRPDLLTQGHVGEVGSHTRVLVETRFEFNGFWGSWSEHADRTVVARKMQVRLTLERETETYEPRIRALTYAATI